MPPPRAEMLPLLAQLRAVLPLPAGPTDVSGREGRALDWPLVASGLRELRASLEAELAALSAQTEAVDARLGRQLASPTAPREEEGAEACVERIEGELGQVLPGLSEAERHFGRVAALVHLSTTRLAQLEARAALLAAALEVETRGRRAKQHAIEATPEALASFTAFSAFVHALPAAYTAVREEAQRRLDVLAVDLRRFAVAKLQRALSHVDWPTPLGDRGDALSKEVDDVASAFAYLVTLQLSQQGRSDGHRAASTADVQDSTSKGIEPEDDALWAMDCVLDAVLVRFRYHFERPESATNRLAKPEWMFLHILEQTRAHAPFADDVLTPELRKHRDALHCWDARVLILRGLIAAAQRQLIRNMPVLATHPPLLCHVIDEVLLFEQAIDDEFEYGAFADNAGDRWRYPRCVDALTSDSTSLFAWTKADVEYSLQMLSSRSSSPPTEDRIASSNGSSKAWRSPHRVGGTIGDSDSDAVSLALVPPIASDVTLLLDFLSRRFFYMGSDEHRYLYVVQVFYPLLRQFADSGNAHGSTAIEKISRTLRESTPAERLNAWRELFGVVNALQHVMTTLAAWEQSSVFLELANKLARSEASRSNVLKLQAAYAQTRERLATAAKAASQAVLSSEEATAVRQALTGPGSMIGPTAAFSAAYAVGSKTMKSIFGGRDGEGENDRSAGVPAGDEDTADGQASGLRSGSSAGLRAPTNKAGASLSDKNDGESKDEEEDAEAALLFSHSIFERQISDLKAVIGSLLRNATSALKHVLFVRDMQLYRSSAIWKTAAPLCDTDDDDDLQPGVSSEIAQSLAVTAQVLSLAQRALPPECAPLVWKPLAGSLDDLLFAVISDGPLARALGGTVDTPGRWARSQLRADLNALPRVFAICAPARAARSYLRKTSDLSQLLTLSPAKLGELRRALDQRDGGDDVNHTGNSAESSHDDGELGDQALSVPSDRVSARRLLDGVRFAMPRTDDAGADAMEQLTTMLEACGIFTLTPSQVLRLLRSD